MDERKSEFYQDAFELWVGGKDGGGYRYLGNDKEQATLLNKEGYTVSWSIHSFEPCHLRRKENISEIRGVMIDVDDISKEEILSRAQKYAVPTFIVESKRSLHLYWIFKESVKVQDNHVEIADQYRQLLVKRFIPVFDGDKQAAAVTTVLRAPGYLHLKDFRNPYEVKIIYHSGIEYDSNGLFTCFPDRSVVEVAKSYGGRKDLSGDEFWERVQELDVVYALEKLSGSTYVGGESFKFVPDGSGFRIWCNGKPANWWVDSHGKLGSNNGAGPTVIQALMYYGHSKGEAARIVKEYFPETEREK